MHSHNTVEHFVTPLGSNFLPMGMALHDSLMRHGLPFHLWVICMGYEAYLAAIRKNLVTMKRFSIPIPCIKEAMTLKERLVKVWRRDPHFARIF